MRRAVRQARGTDAERRRRRPSGRGAVGLAATRPWRHDRTTAGRIDAARRPGVRGSPGAAGPGWGGARSRAGLVGAQATRPGTPRRGTHAAQRTAAVHARRRRAEGGSARRRLADRTDDARAARRGGHCGVRPQRARGPRRGRPRGQAFAPTVAGLAPDAERSAASARPPQAPARRLPTPSAALPASARRTARRVRVPTPADVAAFAAATPTDRRRRPPCRPHCGSRVQGGRRGASGA